MKSGVFVLFENYETILILIILCILFFLVIGEGLKIQSKVKNSNTTNSNFRSYISEIDLKGSRIQAIVFLVVLVGVLGSIYF
jgi:hypothetical protein